MKPPRGLWLLFLAAPVMAQLESLSTTYNGARAYFVTRLQQIGRNQPAHGKAFWAHTSGVYPQLIRRPEGNYADLTGIGVSADASTVVVTAQSCGTPPCRSNSVQSTVFPRRNQPQRYDGPLILSPNGEWALRVVQPGDVRVRIAAVHLETRREETYYEGDGPYCPGCQAIADDGTAAISINGLQVRSADGLKFDRPGAVLRTTLSADAQTVAWESRDGIYVLQAPFTRKPVRLAGRNSRLVSLDRDGTLALFLWAPDAGELRQAYIAQTDGTLLRQVTFEAAGIRSATLSGNGRVVWAFTNDRRLLKLEPQRRKVELISTMPPTVASVALPIGSAADISAPVVAGENIRLRIDGIEPPNTVVETGKLRFQVPWELEPGDAEVQVLSEADFEWTASPTPARLQATLPGLVLVSGEPTIAHEDWKSRVSKASPARRSETIHLYATGLGPVVPALRTGEPAQAAAALAQPLNCEYNMRQNPGTPLTLSYSGPAPGTIGYYQISFRVPANLETYENNIRCRQGDDFLWINVPVEP
jgi:uncharacterized protein (TIGR03437 family)